MRAVQALSTYLQRELTVHSQLSHPFVIGFKRVRTLAQRRPAHAWPPGAQTRSRSARHSEQAVHLLHDLAWVRARLVRVSSADRGAGACAQVFYTMEFVVMVLEHASHGSLASYEWPGVIGSASRTGMARYFFQQLIAAVAYCHEHGVVHRDLKHENTLVSEESFGEGREFLVLKVSDFGMCREDETPNHASGKGSRVGSVPYMAPVRARSWRAVGRTRAWHGARPARGALVGAVDACACMQEVIQANNIGTPEAGRAADVWACAVHFYKMLFGRLPFAGGADWRAVSTNIVHGNVLPPPPNAANAHILDLLERMFRVDRTQRISVPEIQRHPAFLASLPPEIAVRSPVACMSAWLPRAAAGGRREGLSALHACRRGATGCQSSRAARSSPGR